MILSGLSTTQHMGEVTPSLDILASMGRGPLEVECWWSPVDKIESPGWAAGAHADLSRGWAVGGVGYSYRHTEAWTKDAVWLRAGVQGRGLKLMAAQDVKSHNRVSKLELRARGRVGWLIVEPHGFVASYKQGAGRQVGYGVGLRLGTAFSGGN